jgi:hypothetical protein
VSRELQQRRLFAWLLRDESGKEQRIGDSYANTAPDVADAHRTLAKALRAGADLLDPVLTQPSPRAVMQCPAGHGPMHYDISDDRLHCHCGAVATTHGNVIVDPDLVDMEPKPYG